MKSAHGGTLAAKRLNSPKAFLIAAAAPGIAADAAAIVCMAVEGAAFPWFLFPALSALIGAAFLGFACVSNFRFRYTQPALIAYAVVSAAVTAVAAYAALGTAPVVQTTAAACVWVGGHALSLAGVLCTALYAARIRLFSRIPVAAVALAVCAVCAAFGVYYMADNGYSGQGGGIRPLSYEYDEQRQGYSVSGVVQGRAERVVIPDAFNGAPVVSVDCAVFAAEGVTRVELACGADVRFLNYAALSSVDPALQVFAPRDEADLFRTTFFTAAAAQRSDEAFALPNAIRPSDMGEDEVFVTFSYDYDAYRTSGRSPLPVWYGRAGDSLDLQPLEEEYPYLQHADASNEEDLYWNYSNADGNILSGIVDAAGNDLRGARVEQSVVGAVMRFERVYRVTVGDDNDTRYEDEDFRRADIAGEGGAYRYVIPLTAQALLSQLTPRAGFDVSWEYDAEDGRHALTDFGAVLAERAEDEIAVYPVWRLKAPALTLSTDRPGNAVTYGDEGGITLSAAAESELAGAQYSYSWNSRSAALGTGATYAMPAALPADSGTYTAEAELSSSVTSLTATAVASIVVTVHKKQLTFAWELPVGEALVYDGQIKSVSCAPEAGQAVGADEIGYSLSGTENCLHAGSYIVRIVLNSDTAERYAVAEESVSRTVTIAPRPVSLTWQEERAFVYDGQQKTIRASGVVGAVAGEEAAVLAALLYTGGGVHAGEYTVTAALPEGGDYLFSSPQSMKFTVSPRAIFVAAWEQTALVYNGELQYPRATALSDAVAGEEAAVLAALLYTGGGVHAGEYTVTAALPEGGDYLFSSPQSMKFTVSPRAIFVAAWEQTALVYNGELQYPRATALSDAVAGEEAAVLAALLYTGGGVHAGEYTVTAALPAEAVGYDVRDYSFAEVPSQTFTVSPRSVSLAWQEERTFVYDGQQKTIRASGVVGAVAGEEAAVLAALLYTGGGVHAGEYTVTAALPAEAVGYDVRDYSFAEVPSQTFTVSPRAVTIAAWEQTALVYNGELQYPRATALSDAVAGEETAVLAALLYTGGGVDAGEYTVTAALPEGGDYLFSSPQSVKFTVSPRSAELAWEGEDPYVYVFDGATHTPTAACTEQATVVYSYAAADGTVLEGPPSEAGEYRVTARVEDKNYTAAAIETTFTIVADEAGGEDEA